MKIQPSSRLKRMGSAIFSEVAEWKEESRRRGKDLIDLGIGSPDRPPSPVILEAISRAVANPSHYAYPSSEGTPAFRGAVARWYKHRFGVELAPDREVLALMGSQDGLAHLALALTDPGDLALVPDPGYPIYAAGLVLAGVEAYPMPLTAANGFLPELKAIPADIAKRAKFMLLNFPSNPLAATADEGFLREAVEFAKQHDLLLVHDFAYSEMAFDGYRPVSILQIPGAKETAVEFHSLSKSFNMAGCRIAFLVGHEEAVGALRTLKANIDYGVFLAVQEAGTAALEEDIRNPNSTGDLYERRRDVFLEALERFGWNIPKPKATMFLWAPIPQGWTSRQISREILLETGVVVIPGDAFGRQGEGYVRIALVQEEDRLVEAAERIGRFLEQAGER
ncbi:aminotransferase class I/II-fold pyridoxal phosphate-dependent enzyme [Paenibacillus sp. CC-CFT747]|nr:aminotransferase class I/II-fold pyridoxal phosphate-dependent enzyme [Paenibacillus sp. CC-CFT747]